MRRRPAWLLIGEGLDESATRVLVSRASIVLPDLGVAMVGPPDDWKRCERWTRRGCRVYLSSSSDLKRCVNVMQASVAYGVLLIDRALQDSALSEVRRLPAGINLTPREQQVLTLVRVGRSNGEIAYKLKLREHTVETHVQHLRNKLGARNRVELVSRAVALGLEPRSPANGNGGRLGR